MNRIGAEVLALVVALLTAPPAWPQQARPDREGTKDHPLVPRYASSYIVGYTQKAFDEYYLPTGRFGATPPNEQRLEGKYTGIHYYFPEDRSTLEVFRNYEQALSKTGFKPVFQCHHADCSATSGAWQKSRTLGAIHPKTSRYLAAKWSRPNGDVYAAVHVDEGKVYLDVLETKPMEARMIVVDAKTMAGDISRTGHVSLYGIHFDTDKADLRPESSAALKEIGALMKNDPKLKLLVVGHTDNTGSFEHNLDLSRRRAESVVKALTATYGVAGARLKAQGAGAIAPVATNRTEEGRALNRRVELVEQ